MDAEKKCTECAFCRPRIEGFGLPNDWICRNVGSKWFGYWPPNSTCESYTARTEKPIDDDTSESKERAMRAFAVFWDHMSGNNSGSEGLKEFLKQHNELNQKTEGELDGN